MKILYQILFISILFACQPEPLIVEDVPVADKKLVVSTVVGSDQILTLFLTQSYGALSGDVNANSSLLAEFVVPNAAVTLRSQSDEFMLENIGLGIYGTNDVNLISGETYELDVYDPQSNQHVVSETQMMQAVRFDTLSIEMELGSIDTVVRVKYKFQDVTGPSFYMINVQKASQQFETPEQILDNRVFTQLVNDGQAKDGFVEDEFLALLRNTSLNDTLLISLSNISFEYYDYLDRINYGFLGPSLITEPYNYPSNVENGYGFFNLYYKDFRLLQLSQ